MKSVVRINSFNNLKPGDVLISENDIAARLTEIAKEIAEEYSGRHLVIVGILKGVSILIADLQRALYKEGYKNFTVSFISVKSYGSGTESSQKPQIYQDIDIDPKEQDILLVDDVIDTGSTLQYIDDLLRKRGARSVRSLALLSKPDRRVVSYETVYTGFIISDVWVEGYGMDSNEYGRGNPDIIIGPSFQQ